MESQFVDLITTALGEAPVLLIVLYYLYKNNKEWREYLAEQNGKLQKVLEKMSDAIDRSHRREDNTK